MIKAMIEWRSKPGKEKALEGMLQDLRSKAMRHQGYISGETLVGVEDPATYVVVSTWTRLEAWKIWENSRERQELVRLIAPNVSEETSVRVFKPPFEEGVG
jgi:heme-degrading monooxygenase HmoA